MKKNKKTSTSNSAKKKDQISKKFGNPKEALKMLGQWVVEGDISASTDLLVSYIKHSPKYKGSKKKFAKAIGTTKKKLKQVLVHHKKSSMMNFIRAVEQIHKDLSTTTKSKTKSKKA